MLIIHRSDNLSHSFIKRCLFYFAGLIILSVGVAMQVKGFVMGLSPWDVLHFGLWQSLGLTFGSWSVIVGIGIVIATSLILKALPKGGVYVNLVTIGAFIDFFVWILPDAEAWPAQALFFTAGVFIAAFGSAFYMTPNLGAGPRDSLMMVLVMKFNLRMARARFLMELTVAVLGLILGGPVFIGTVLIVLFYGRIIEMFFPYTRELLIRFIGYDDPKIIQFK
ncbi:YitT family protein [Jeotgalicoccus nanhaiensis]|jgi:Predicted membrane protein|uniref:YitT family protein n=1 Tax=Jeotgalicoccus nanhaiensis TaxID=568603 RepID=A0ABR9XYE8_9STAP|nr:YitT family protein [Jeotgalicoccus nanhaiensis]TFU62080.1 YitT family protein [Jeotgalicoccus nanhaiensis]